MSKFYAVKNGRQTGIFRTWTETEKLVKGFKGAKYKSFKTETEALDYLGTSNQAIPYIAQPQNDLETFIRKTRRRKTRRRETLIDNALSSSREGMRKPVQGIRPAMGIAMIELLTTHAVYYTDGSCVNKVGGYGFVALSLNGEQPGKGKVPYYPTTNQVSELYAILQAISHAKEYSNGFPVLIYTDSKYSIGCLTMWFHNWKRNGWVNAKGKPVENQDLIKSILDLMKSISVKFKHVKAHNGDKYNEIADRLANEGRLC